MTTFSPLNPNITVLRAEDIPEGTTKIVLSLCPSLTDISALRNLTNLTDLDLGGCRSLTDISALGNLTNLTRLKLYGTSLTDTSALGNLTKLTDLDLANCRSLKDISALGNLTNLRELNLFGCRSLTDISALGNLTNLTRLKLYDTSLTDTSALRNLTNLTNLDLCYCTSLTDISALGNLTKLTDLNLRGCDSLPNNLSTINILEDLERKAADAGNTAFTIRWPQHLDRGARSREVKENISEAYLEHCANNPDFAGKTPNVSDAANFPTLVLVHRFMTESIGQRGGIHEIVNSALKVSQAIKENPDLLEVTDFSSSHYLQGCVNQPVAGFIQIANLIEISKQSDIPVKLEKAKALIALEAIANGIREIKNPNGAPVGVGVEVELYNAMVQKVHKKLVHEQTDGEQEISEPWAGTPDGIIVHEGTIKAFLTEENINLVTQKAKDALKLPLEEVAELMCEELNFQDLWAKITLTKEELTGLQRSQNEQIKALKERYSKMDGANASPEALKKLETDIKKLENARYSEVLKASKEKTYKEKTYKRKLDGDYSQERQTKVTKVTSIKKEEEEEVSGVVPNSDVAKPKASSPHSPRSTQSPRAYP